MVHISEEYWCYGDGVMAVIMIVLVVVNVTEAIMYITITDSGSSLMIKLNPHTRYYF